VETLFTTILITQLQPSVDDQYINLQSQPSNMSGNIIYNHPHYTVTTISRSITVTLWLPRPEVWS
jgi:hypothetical protein